MAVIQTMLTNPTNQRRVSTASIAPAVAGLLIGIAECPFFALTLFRVQLGVLLWRVFGFAASQREGTVIFVAVTVVPLLAGSGFAWLLSRQMRTRWWRLWLIGPILLLAGVLGLVVVGAFESSLSVLPASATLLIFRLAFVLASALAAFAFTYSVARLLQLGGSFRKAMLTAAVTGAAYLLLALVIDVVPGWHVGGGNAAMIRVALVGNLLAGLVGGTAAFRLLLPEADIGSRGAAADTPAHLTDPSPPRFSDRT
jgi:hypothetical protein